MPWNVRKKGNKWEIYKSDTGEVVGYSDTKEKAEASVRARYWGASKKGEKLTETVDNMTNYVNVIANRVLKENIEIEGKEYEPIPDDVLDALSGSMAVMFGVKIRDGIGYTPVGRAKSLIKQARELCEKRKKKLCENKKKYKVKLIKMADLEKLAVLTVELNELAKNGWDTQTVIFKKDGYKKREDALKKAKEMGFNISSSRETGDEDEGSWRIRQKPNDDFSEFKTKIINDNISLVVGKLKKEGK